MPRSFALTGLGAAPQVVMREVSLSDREATVRAFEDFAAFYTDDAGEES